MEKKPTSTTKKLETAAAPRHRFTGDGEKTTIMPLSEILRTRDTLAGAPVADEADRSDRTSISSPGAGIRSKAEAGDFTQTPTKPHKVAVVKPAARSEPASRQEPTAPGKAAALAQTGSVKLPTMPAAPTKPVAAAAPAARAPVKAPTPNAPSLKQSNPDLKQSNPDLRQSNPDLRQSNPDLRQSNPDLRVTGEKKIDPVRRKQVTVFFSCKGGSGATTLSTNVAHYYAQDQYKTCLVDLDFQLGDSLASLGLQPSSTIADAIGTAQRGEAAKFSVLPQHASGVSVLSQVGSLDDLDKISSEGMAALLEGMRATFDMLVVDGVRDFSDNVLAVLDVADKIAIVTVQEVLALRRARWAFGILRKIGFDPKEITVVVNRFDAESEISVLTLRKIFEPGKVIAIPNEPTLVLQSLNRGVPLREINPSHNLTRNIGRMAAGLAGDTQLDLSEAIVVPKKAGVLSSLAFWRKR